MTQDEIRRRRAAIKEEMAEAQDALEIARAKSRSLQRRCTHPDKRRYSAMGDLGDICDDCGYQT